MKKIGLIFIIIPMLYISCRDSKSDIKNKLFGSSELSSLEEYIISYNDSKQINWSFFNRMKYCDLTVFSINNNKDSLEFIAVNKNNNDIVIFFKDRKYFIFEQREIIPQDSVNVHVE